MKYASKCPGYHSWAGMHRRCYDENFISFQYYGAKGIKVCDRWELFDNFISDMGERPDGTTLDRKKSTEDYSPENCRWSTILQQNNNRGFCIFITYQGETRTLKQWARHLRLNYQSLYYRHTVMQMQVPEIFERPMGRIYK